MIYNNNHNHNNNNNYYYYFISVTASDPYRGRVFRIEGGSKQQPGCTYCDLDGFVRHDVRMFRVTVTVQKEDTLNT